MPNSRLSSSSMRSRSNRTIGCVKAGNGVRFRSCAPAEVLHAKAAGELPVIVPLIIAADIAHDIGVDAGERAIDEDPAVLHSREQPSRLIRIQCVVRFEDRVVGRRGQRRVWNRPRHVGLNGDGRKHSAVLLIDVGLESEGKAEDSEIRPGTGAGLRRTAADAAIDRELIVDIDGQGQVDRDAAAGG